MRHPTLIAAAAALIALAAGPAAAKTLTFRGTLGGTRPPAMTGSPARGVATVKVDTSSGKLWLDVDVTGITLDQLDKAQVAKATGPVHLNEVSGPGDIEVLLPIPYGATYQATKTGFRVTVRDYDYAQGLKIAGANVSLDEFVTAMRAGRIVLNIQTDRFPEGEISGEVS